MLKNMGYRLAVILVSAVLSVDGLIALASILSLLALGGYLTLLWPYAYFYLMVSALGILAIVAFMVFVLIPAIMASEDWEDD